ncbi:MAG: type II toxin-antitoxin system VapC family toxin [Spirochaetia bacterium]
MTLVDTSVWVDHFRKGNSTLSQLLNESQVLTHPFVIGELACGNLKNRTEILKLLKELPPAVVAENNEVMQFIEKNRLYGVGIGWIDAHLIASALLSEATVMTLDKQFGNAVSRLNL